MKVVVTGATGNIGTSTLEALASEPKVQEIVGLARHSPALQFPKTRFERADVTTDDLTPYFRGADAVVHLAWLIQPARERDLLHRVNVEGSRRVFEMALAAGVPALVYASSVGVYSHGPKDRRVDERWPTDGISTSTYSMHKVAVERELDRLERKRPSLRVVRMRPALVFKREAASEIGRLFVGPMVPRWVFHKDRIPFVPQIDRFRFQCVHSRDVGRAFALATLADARGAFNIATDPVLDSNILAETLHAKRLPIPEGLLRGFTQAAWRLHLTPSDKGWVDLALQAPLMDVSRARELLGWVPRKQAPETLLELFEGLRQGKGAASVPLQP